MKIILSTILLLSFLNAASFDCKKASSIIEKAICSNPELSRLDNLLSLEYKEAKNLFTNEEKNDYKNEQWKSALKNEQIQWMKNRKKCHATNLTQCLKGVYKTRINELELYRTDFNSYIDPLSGQYEWKASNSEASLNIQHLSESKYLVYGSALYGTKNEFGPNIGNISFISEIKSKQIIWQKSSYILTLKFDESNIIATENEPGPFGMNVSFTGSYTKAENTIIDLNKNAQSIKDELDQ